MFKLINLYSVFCITPTSNSLQSFGVSSTTVSLITRLSVIKSDDNAYIASTNFTFYDCNQIKTCIQCANSQFPCDWCTLTAKCVSNAEDVCQGETLVNSISVNFSSFFFLIVKLIYLFLENWTFIKTWLKSLSIIYCA